MIVFSKKRSINIKMREIVMKMVAMTKMATMILEIKKLSSQSKMKPILHIEKKFLCFMRSVKMEISKAVLSMQIIMQMAKV